MKHVGHHIASSVQQSFRNFRDCQHRKEKVQEGEITDQKCCYYQHVADNFFQFCLNFLNFVANFRKWEVLHRGKLCQEICVCPNRELAGQISVASDRSFPSFKFFHDFLTS